MSKRRLVAVLALGAVALVGCGNGSDKPSAGGGSGTTDNGSNGGDDSGFSELLAKAKAARYKITYTNGDGGDEFTLAQDPPLFAYITDGSATYVTADDEAVSCSGTGSEATCTKMPGTGDTYRASLSSVLGAAGALFLGAAGSSIPGLLDIKTSTEEIAGRDAECATIDSSTLGALGAAIKGSYSVCVDKETGVMLRVRSDDGSGSSDDLTAIKFEEPTDEDFTPPVTPDTIPGQ